MARSKEPSPCKYFIEYRHMNLDVHGFPEDYADGVCIEDPEEACFAERSFCLKGCPFREEPE